MKTIAAHLHEKGLKVTPQRIAIYSYLQSTKAHPSAETIFKLLEPTNPTMSLATVYKTLDAFEKVGLVMELNVGEGRSRYDAEVRSHPHLVCRTCGEVYDLPCDALTGLREAAQILTDFEIESEQLYFYGKCAHCQEKEREEKHERSK
mgnify:CR=1 FL=1